MFPIKLSRPGKKHWKISHWNSHFFLKINFIRWAIHWFHLGLKAVSGKTKFSMVGLWIFGYMSQSTLRTQNFKIVPLWDFEKKHRFSRTGVRKPFQSGQNLFLRPFFALIEGIFGLYVPCRALNKTFFIKHCTIPCHTILYMCILFVTLPYFSIP